MTEPRTITTVAVCGECETQFSATHKPDACFACGVIDGPWVLLTLRSELRGASVSVTTRAHLVGTWSAAARAQALVALGSLVEGA